MKISFPCLAPGIFIDVIVYPLLTTLNATFATHTPEKKYEKKPDCSAPHRNIPDNAFNFFISSFDKISSECEQWPLRRQSNSVQFRQIQIAFIGTVVRIAQENVFRIYFLQ